MRSYINDVTRISSMSYFTLPTINISKTFIYLDMTHINTEFVTS